MAAAASLKFHLQAFQAAQQHRCYLAAVRAAAAAVSLSGVVLSVGGSAALGRGTADAALQAFAAVEAGNYKDKDKRLLPEFWLTSAESEAMLARRTRPELQRFLTEGPPAQSQRRNFRAMYEPGNLPDLTPRCSGCSRKASGLRKCARCRQVSYCR